MKLVLNGEEREFSQPLTIHEMLVSLGLDPKKVAVERNLEIVPKSTFEVAQLAEGDRIEVVHFIGGGQ